MTPAMATTSRGGKRAAKTRSSGGGTAARKARRTATGKHDVVLIGGGNVASSVRTAVVGMGLSVLRARQPETVLMGGTPQVQAILAVPPLPSLSVLEFCRRLQEERIPVPLYVITGFRMARRDQLNLYGAGTDSIFEWPKEREAFVRTVVRTIVSNTRRMKKTGVRSTALAARIEQRLREERKSFGPLLRVKVRNGIVYLQGEVDSLWKVHEARRIAESTPGVKDTVVHGLRVAPEPVPDRSISAAIRSILRNTTDLDESTIAITVSGGHLRVTGTAESRQEMRWILEVLTRIRGIRSLENLMKVSPESKRRERSLASDISENLKRHFPSVRVQVSVFGSVAVLGGEVRGATTRRAIVEETAMTPGIERVVDKLV